MLSRNSRSSFPNSSPFRFPIRSRRALPPHRKCGFGRRKPVATVCSLPPGRSSRRRKEAESHSRHFFLHGIGDRIHVLQNFLRGRGVGDFHAEIFIETHHKLQCVQRIQSQTSGTEEREVVRDFRRGHLQHEVLHHHCLNAFF